MKLQWNCTGTEYSSNLELLNVAKVARRAVQNGELSGKWMKNVVQSALGLSRHAVPSTLEASGRLVRNLSEKAPVDAEIGLQS